MFSAIDSNNFVHRFTASSWEQAEDIASKNGWTQVGMLVGEIGEG